MVSLAPYLYNTFSRGDPLYLSRAAITPGTPDMVTVTPGKHQLWTEMLIDEVLHVSVLWYIPFSVINTIIQNHHFHYSSIF